jgi:hypothetical protein
MIQYGYYYCQQCEYYLDGGMIPVEYRKLYGGADRYSKLIQKLGGLICPQCRIVVNNQTKEDNHCPQQH